MSTETRGYWRNGEWKFTLLVIGLTACIPTGIILWLFTENGYWLWLVAPLVLFIS